MSPQRAYGFPRHDESGGSRVRRGGMGLTRARGLPRLPGGLLRQPIVMRGLRGRSGRRLGRLTGAVLIAVSLAVSSSTVSSARPSRQDLADAKARLLALNQRLSQLVEQYDAAKVALGKVANELSEARARAEQARSEAERARAYFANRARGAYEGVGAGIDVLLGA